MAGYEITYNGFGTNGAEDYKWTHINIQNYQSTPQFSEDDQTQWTTKHTLSGTAIIGASSANNLQTAIINAQSSLQKQHRLLHIEINDEIIAYTGTNSFDVVGGLAGTGDISALNTDHAGYPRCSFSIDKLYGTKNALVSFSFEWMAIYLLENEVAESQWAVLSHHWQQNFNIAENGLTTWTIDGTLHVRPWSVANNQNDFNNLDRNPDSYRRVVMPYIPWGFRVQSMRWGTDKTGDKLVYTIVLQEHARGLPYPATKGTGSFVFKKSIDSQAGLLGIKMFDAELEGDAAADTTSLLAALLQASTKRINWVPAEHRPRDLITSIEVRETDIFSKKRIGLRITARGIDPNIIDAVQGTGGKKGLGFGILTDFVDNEIIARPIDPYGSALICSFKRELFIEYASYNNEIFPKAKLRSLPGSPTGNTSGVNTNVSDLIEDAYQVPDEYIVDEVESEDLGSTYWDPDTVSSPDDILFKYIKVRGTERIAQKSNIMAFSTHGAMPYHLAWQVEAPRILMESEYTITRQGEPPPLLLYKIPLNGVMIDEQSSVEAGEIDGNGNRMFTRHIKRTVQLLYGWTDGDDGDNVEEVWQTHRWDLAGIGTLEVAYAHGTVSPIKRPYDVRTDSKEDIERFSLFQAPDNVPDAPNEFYDMAFDFPIGYVDAEP